MKLGIDIDGPCIDFVQAMRNVLGVDHPSPTVWNMIDEWGFTGRKAAWDAAIREAQFLSSERASDFWALTNKDMAVLEDHELYVITARSPEQMTGILQEFSNHNLKVTGVIFSSLVGKSVWAVKLGLKAFLEDRYDTALEFTSTVPCWLINKTWNQNQVWPRRVNTVAEYVAAALKLP